MKHQYFGDHRALFMFDLVLEVLSKTGLRQLTYIPMLTRDNDSEYVLRTEADQVVAGRDNTVLRDYLHTCLSDGKRSIYETEGIFRLPGFNRFTFTLHRLRFQDQSRMQYFLSIPEEDLGDAVILLDPDEGMWSSRVGGEGEKYLRFDEIRHIYETMDPASVLILFEHLPDKGRYESVSRVMQRLKEWVTHGRPPLSISDRRETFFLLTRDNSRQGELERLVRDYETRYGLSLEE